MKEKPTLVYFNHDCFTQVDDTVLPHLVDSFHVVWFYFYESLSSANMRYNPEKAKAFADRYGITLEIADPMMRRRNPKNYFFYKDLARKINQYRPDIVYSCDTFPFWSFCYRNIQCKNKVLGIHDVKMHSYKFSVENVLFGWNKDYWQKKFKHCFTFSPNQHDLLLSEYGKESWMVGMSCKSFGESEATPPPIDNEIKLLFFGNIHPYKGLDLLINAMEELFCEGTNNLRLTIAGRGPSWEDCQKLMKTSSLYNVQVRFIQNDEIPDMMSSHHFLVLPYRNATQSGPLVAALSYQLPVIAPNYGCFKDTYDSKSAFLYEKDGLKEALLGVSKLSQSEYDTIKQGAASLKEEFSEEKIAQNYIDAFMSIMEGHGEKKQNKG